MDKLFAGLNSWAEERPSHGLVVLLTFIAAIYWMLAPLVPGFSLGVKTMYWVGLMIVASPLPWILSGNNSAVDSPALLPENAKFTMYRDENGIYVIRSDSRPHFVRCAESPDEAVQKMAVALEAERS